MRGFLITCRECGWEGHSRWLDPWRCKLDPKHPIHVKEL